MPVHVASSTPWWRSQAWWIDHWADVIGAIVIPLLLYMIDCNSKSAGDNLVQQQLDLQQLSMKQSAADADNHQALGLLADMGTRSGDERRAIALAMLEYSMQGRLYHPSTAVVVDYLKRECDATTYGLLTQAVQEAFRHIPKNAPTPSCDEEDKDSKAAKNCQQKKKEAQSRVDGDTNLDKNLLAEAQRAHPSVCAQTSTTSQAAANILIQYSGPGPRTFRQYLDVGCAETNQGRLVIRLSEEEQKILRIASVKKPDFEGVSNLNWDNAEQPIVAPDGNSISLPYAIRGLDRQYLGNCPGGGHATLVVVYQLASRNAEQQTQTPIQEQR